MKCSVIIPCYNAESTLKVTTDSIRDSGLTDYEILLVDDGSSGGTPVLCDRLAETYPNIRCVHQPNGGVSSARNRGIEEAKGDYLLFFDSDDMVDAGTLSEASELLVKHKPDMLLYGMTFDYYHNGTCYRQDKLVCKSEGLFSKTEWISLLLELFYCNYLSPVWNKFIRRDLVLKSQVSFRKEMHLMEDFLFSAQCLEHCDIIYLMPEAIYHYRQSEDEGNTARRLNQISSLVDYMDHFSGLSEPWDGIIDSVYYMLLHQKVRASSAKEIAEIAADHRRSTLVPQTDCDRWLSQQLEAGNYNSLYLRNLKSQARHKMAVFAKSHGLWK